MAVGYRLYHGSSPASQAALSRIREIRVDQAIGMAAEAVIVMPIEPDDQGVWQEVEADYNQPDQRVRIEVRAGDAQGLVPLIDGPVAGQRFTLTAASGGSEMSVVVHDDTALLNRTETVEVFEELGASDIATQLFAAAGMGAEVDSIPAPGGGLERVVVQRGTAMQLLRELARRHGVFVYVKPGPSVGASTGVFREPELTPGDSPVLRLLGPERNVEMFECEFNGLHPTTARAGGINVVDKSVLSAQVDSASLQALAARPAHELVQPGTTLLARTREESADLDAAAAAAVNTSSWAYSAQVEVNGDTYGSVLQPHQVVTVAGPGGYLGGHYLVSRVRHTITTHSYRQQVSLLRNARADAGAGPGSLAGGVF